MRQIGSKQNLERKRKKNNLILGLILIGIMLFSVLGYGLSYYNGGGNDNKDNQEGQEISYNGFDFVNNNGFWFTQINGESYSFFYNPEQISVKNIEVPNLDYYKDKTVYIVSENPGAESEISSNLYSSTSRIQKACLEGKECANDALPIKTCEDNVIVIESDPESKGEIYQEENCIFIKGQDSELIKLSDEFIFHVLGIR